MRNNQSSKSKQIARTASKFWKELQARYPGIADDYRNGMTKRDIAREYSVGKMFDVGEQLASSIVYCALSGNGTYEGLLTRGELEKLGREHKYNVLSLENCSILGRKGAVSKGQTLWSDAERWYVTALSVSPEFRINSEDSKYKTVRGAVDLTKIAEAVNEYFHESKPVRSYQAVSNLIKKSKKILVNYPLNNVFIKNN
ncbi:MAG TPA: hypothetical protein VI815_04320 [Candidatus Nanoarchaeia archaeon]|nr:hypothetical protein [Candidatus Nanoarchaeia archaeon]